MKIVMYVILGVAFAALCTSWQSTYSSRWSIKGMTNSWPRRRRAGILTYTVLAAIIAVNVASFMGVINSRPHAAPSATAVVKDCQAPNACLTVPVAASQIIRDTTSR